MRRKPQIRKNRKPLPKQRFYSRFYRMLASQLSRMCAAVSWSKKKNSENSKGESASQRKVLLRKKLMTCSLCKEKGHNKRACASMIKSAV